MPRTTDSKQCYSCGGVGHIQADCPSIRVARNAGGAAGRCYNCGMFGHMARVCRNAPRFNGPPMPRNHFNGPPLGGRNNFIRNNGSNDAFNANNNTNNGNFGVNNGNGNFSNNNNNNGGNFVGNGNSASGFGGPGGNHHQGGGGRVICYKCGGLNHFSRDCKASGVKCYNCNMFGHLSRECTDAPRVQVCFKCQQEGHI
ncbi:hypothetical protein BGX24_005785, partial [Mortierella sp. AD032]